VVLLFGVATRKVRSTTTSDQQSVTGEDTIPEQETHGVLSVPGSVDNFERKLAEVDLLTVVDSQINVAICGAVHHDSNAVTFAHDLARGIMIGVGMSVDGVENRRPEEAR